MYWHSRDRVVILSEFPLTNVGTIGGEVRAIDVGSEMFLWQLGLEVFQW